MTCSVARVLPMPERPTSKAQRERVLAEERSRGFFYKNVLCLMLRTYGGITITSREVETLGQDEIDMKTQGTPSHGTVRVQLTSGRRPFPQKLRAAWKTFCEA